jgi:hypothetical protein
MKWSSMFRSPEFIAAVVGGIVAFLICEVLKWLLPQCWNYAGLACHHLGLWLSTPVTLTHASMVALSALTSLAGGLVTTWVASRYLAHRWPPAALPHGHR